MTARSWVRSGLVAVLATMIHAISGGSPVAAQQSATGTILGVVTAVEAGEELGGVLVEVVELRRRGLTNGAGRYAFGGVPAGSYTLRFSRLGQTMHEQRVTIGAGTEVVVDAALGTEAIDLPPLMVLLGRTRLVGDVTRARQLPGSAHVIDRTELAALKLPFDDINMMLRQVPGVNIQQEEGFGLRPNLGMRGTGTERSSKVTLMEDGILIAPAPYAAPAAYYFPVAGRMEAIEVRKGSSQVKYGPRTIGGAVNLVSSSVPADFGVSLDAGAGPNGSRKVVARMGDSYTNGGWLLETYQLQTDGFKVLDGSGPTGFDVEDYIGKVRLNTDRQRSGAYHEVEVKFGRYGEASNETYVGLTDADFRAAPLRRYAGTQADLLNVSQRQAVARYFFQPNRLLDVTATAYRTEAARNWYKLQSVNGKGLNGVLERPAAHEAELAILRGGESADDALKLRTNNREYYAQGIQTAVGVRFETFGVGHDFEVGVRYHQDQEDRFQHENGYRMAAGLMVRTSNGAPGSQENRVGAARALAFYLQEHLTIGRLTLTPGVRREAIAFTRTDYDLGDAERAAPKAVLENEVTAWIPGVGASVLLRPGARVFGGVHRGFGPPGPGAKAETRPETSVNYELGTWLRVGAGGVQLVGFYSDYANILGAATLATGNQGTGDLFNGGSVGVQGLEATADYDLSPGRAALRLPVSLTYTHTRAEFRSAFQSAYAPWGKVEIGDELPYLPRHQLNGTVGVRGDAWSLRLSADHNSAVRTVAGQGEMDPVQSTESFLLFGVGGEYRVSTLGTLYASVQNLTNESYIAARQPAGARPGLPRTFMAGVRVDR
jgi:Fe(3+) dicitrate transport protein